MHRGEVALRIVGLSLEEAAVSSWVQSCDGVVVVAESERQHCDWEWRCDYYPFHLFLLAECTGWQGQGVGLRALLSEHLWHVLGVALYCADSGGV